MDAWLADLSHAFRALRKRPLLAIVAAVSVALGIGATTAIFSVANVLLVRPMPGIARPDRLVEVGRSDAGKGFDTFSYPDYLDLRRDTSTFATLAAFKFQSASVNAGGEGRRLMGMTVTANYLDALGVRPALGRFFVRGEDDVAGQNPVVVISYRLWRDTFKGDSGVIGRTLVLSRAAFQVVGVAPEGFFGHILAVRPDFYVPITMGAAISHESNHWLTSRASMGILLIGRLADGVSRARADAATHEAMARLARDYPATNATRGASVAALGPVPAVGRTAVAAFTAALTAVVALILATVCANVAGMLLARAASRQKDVTMRLVLGSPRGRIIRQVVLESVMIFAAGGAGGLLIATWGTSVLSAASLPVPVEVAFDLRPDLGVLAAGLGVALVTGLAFGLLPALQISNPSLAGVIKDLSGSGGPRAGRLRRAFVIVQVAASITLLAAAGLFLRALDHAAREPLGFTRDGIYMTTLNLALEGYSTAEGLAYQDRLVNRLSQIPGATAVALATDLPLDLSSSGEGVVFERAAAPTGRDSTFDTDFNRVSAGYFGALDMPILSGRGFATSDGPAAPAVVVVDRTFAARAWPGGSAIGQRLRFAGDSTVRTVVGVVEHTPNQQVNETPRPEIYVPLAQSYFGGFHVLVRGAAGMNVAAGILPAVRELGPSVSATPVVGLADYTSIAILPQRAAAGLIASLGALALFLCGLGVYGLMAHDVARRTREIGVRVAVGASPRDVVALVYRSALRVALPGAIAGTVLALGMSQAVRGFLLGLDPLDPVALAVAVGALVLALAAACVTPARRAMRVAPMQALRDE
ncbi:MAG TPA: ABC transporter permease [Gemmatimonadaceae bacterium]|nr:ABC transporter permease [Gemmatimonadaceae bacterium]